MDIAVLKLAASQIGAQTEQTVVPAQDDIEAFQRAVDRSTGNPDEAVIEALGAAERHAIQPMKDIDAAGVQLLDPAQMLSVQKGLAKMSVDIDLAAKAAGSISQGINKLVTMQ
ncbi:type III secretion system inner rod subunit SctI [Burkholderia sp. WSM2232]|uniref:type III secretion system inner rod subunit SctI n=1 Tax=Burkholderia sp. WSM2232 TaxID=944436 RepID=UPI0004097A82|nr:type III secretion system inner rod subunit SctI [Burkholderia sp. WSM2232]